MKRLYSIPIILIMAVAHATYAQVKPTNQNKQNDSIPELVTYKQAVKVEGAKTEFESTTTALEMPGSLGTMGRRAGRDSTLSKASQYRGASGAFMQAAANPAGPTVGQLDVSATGAATYSVPISLPPGIGKMVPELALVYNSQGANGVVGLGWNIAGLSAITRVAPTPFHDDILTAVNFNANDRFALDGQRLILKNGTYGGDGAEYQTENYSNIKIVSRGVSPFGAGHGPAHFEVFYPDGSKAFYGTTNGSRTSTTFALTYMENPLGARINYTYSVSDNTYIVTEIAYGNLGTSQTLNKINFHYSEINRAEMGYTGGDRLYRKSLLNKISVTANGTAYRNYELILDNIPTLNYKRVIGITEYNGDHSQARSPLYFTYNSTGDMIEIKSINNLSMTNIASNNSEVVTADFTGNGSMDFLLVPKSNKNKFWAFYDMEPNSPYMQLGYEVNTGAFKDVFPATLLSWNEKVLPGQGIALVKQNGTSSYKFETYLATSYAPALYQYDRVWENTPKVYGYYSECDGQFHEGPALEQEFISGDFNGDGLTDIIALNRPYYNYIILERKHRGGEPWTNPGEYQLTMRYPISIIDDGGGCTRDYGDMDISRAHFINLDRRVTSNYINNIGYLNKSYAYGDKLYTGDFNGDGKTDLLHLKNGELFVYSLNAGNAALELLWHTPDSRISLDQQILMGDYNGDGKTDIMFSTGYNNLFSMFLSTGRGFQKQEENYPFSNVAPTWNGTYLKEHFLIPTDINGDGKTDIIYAATSTQNNTGGSAFVSVYHNMGTSPSYKQHFALGGSTPGIYIGAHYPIPIFLNSDRSNPRLEFGMLSKNAIGLFNFRKDFRSEAQLASVNQDGVTHQISYRNLGATNGYNDQELPYQSSYDQTYPNIDHHNLAGLNVVDKVARTYNNQTLQQVFGYSLGVSNMQGLGFLGFGKLVRSNWHLNADDQNRMFNITLSDPQLRGAMVNTFTAKLPYVQTYAISNPAPTVNDYLSRTDYTYQTNLLPNKVFVNIPTSITTRDVLSGTGSVQTNEYDSYYNVTKSTSSFGTAGTKTEEATYENNPLGYYIGRPLARKTTQTADGDTYTTEEQYTYTGYLPTQIRKKGNGTPWITENNTFDAYGNTAQKSTTTSTGTRTTKAAYDASGRFAISKTDVEGLTSTATYNPANGNLLSTTNPYGQTTTTAYDTWDRVTEITDYLGKKSYKSYDANANGYSVIDTDDEGRKKTSFTNHLGQATEAIEKTIAGNQLGAIAEYDVYGRAYRKSQPDAPGSYRQWNTTEFDNYGRISKITAYTGQVTQYTYNGSSTTVNDGTRSVTTTKNALGQTIKIQDAGGTINYRYYAHGALKTAEYGGAVQSLEYDGWGRRTKLSDPGAGEYTTTYNGFGETVKETSPKGVTGYTYDHTGKLMGKTINGDATAISYAYTYNNSTKLLEGLTFSNADGNNAMYYYTYDANKRLLSTTEDNLHARFTKSYTYDAFDRIATETYEARDKASNTTATRTVGYTYQNGELLQLTDLATGQVISKIGLTGSNGQLITALQGDKLKTTYNYDIFNLPQNAVTERTGNSPATLMNLGYSFDALRGNLRSRTNSALNWSENFDYDNLDRLTNFNDNSGNNSQSYDNRGRITYNSQLGNYAYNGDSYQQSELTSPTPEATTWYQSRALQQISFNAFKKPVNINEKDKEQIDFQYNAALQRSHMYYGSTDADKMLRPMRRHYSENGGMEITRNINTGETSFIFYLGGDAYSAHAIYKEVHHGSGSLQNLYYLHRDHLGSILLITDVNGNAVEKRHFDAWGNIAKLEDGSGNPLTTFLITDRGYTGHEHLLGVGLINMNGRLYDPKLRRFLSPDNYVQDPASTQNFNRYGYAKNNPLTFIDPTGEILWFVPLIFAAINVVTDLIINNGQMNFGQILSSVVMGGMSGFLGGAKIANVGMAFLSAGVSQLNRFMPNIPLINKENFQLGIAPMIGFGTSGFTAGGNVNASGRIKKFAYGVSIGAGYNSGVSSLGEAAGGSSYWNAGGFAGYFDNYYNYGAGYSYNSFGGKTAQAVGAITLQIGQFGLRVDEDFLGDRKDRYRTGGVLATFKLNKNLTLAAGMSMMTGEMPNDETVEGGNPKMKKGMYDPDKEVMPTLREGSLYGGVIYKGVSYLAGHNSEKRLHAIQRPIHRLNWFITAYFPDRGLPSKMFSYYGGYHTNYLYY